MTSIYDLSGGNKHVQEIAAESGLDHMAYHSDEKTVNVDGYKVDTWYDEDASSAFSAWGAFIKGVGSCTGLSVESAIEQVTEKARKMGV